MSAVASASGVELGYQGPNGTSTAQRALMFGAVVALHAVVIGGFIIARLNPPAPPPETTLTVSLISEAPANPAPTPPQPPQPTPPPPEPRLMATPRPTLSTMTAPPMEKETPREAVQAAPAPPAPSVPASAGPPGPPTITPPNFTAAYLNNPVVYPMAGRRKRLEGTVRLRVQVSADGAPLQVLLDRTSGHAELDEAALDIVRKRWKFAPAKQGDRAVAAWVIVPVEYSITR